MQKAFTMLVGIIIGWITIWVVNLVISYSFHLGNISVPIFSGVGILIGLAEIAIACLPYWLLHKRYPDLAKGILIGVILTVVAVLLLSLLAF